MRISKTSATSAIAATGLALCTAALAQDSAGQDAQEQGAAAMQRVERAISKARQPERSLPHPELPAPPTNPDRRRTADRLRHRATMPEIERRARTAAREGEARMAAQREAMGKRLREALGLDVPALRLRPNASPTRDRWVPVLFVSSSMPMPVLRAYAAQLERVRGVLALRGMPGGLRKVGPMAKFTAAMLRLDPGCDGPRCAMRDVQVIVDPILFRQHGIARVPALAMIPGDPAEPYCERENASPRAGVIVSGDSALSGLFAEYARLGGKKEVKDAQALLGDR